MFKAISTEAKCRTKDVPGMLRVENMTSDSLSLRWNWLNPKSPPYRIFGQYRQVIIK